MTSPAFRSDLPELCAQLAVLRAVSAAVVVKLNLEFGEVADMGVVHFGDQRLFAATLLSSANHDRGAMRVVGANVDAAIPAQLLEPHPDVGLQILDQMTQMDVAIGIREGRSDKDPSWIHSGMYFPGICGGVRLATEGKELGRILSERSACAGGEPPPLSPRKERHPDTHHLFETLRLWLRSARPRCRLLLVLPISRQWLPSGEASLQLMPVVDFRLIELPT